MIKHLSNMHEALARLPTPPPKKKKKMPRSPVGIHVGFNLSEAEFRYLLFALVFCVLTQGLAL